MPTSMWFTRLRHSVLPGRDTVARPSDRLQGAVLLCVIVSSLLAGAGAVLLGIGIHAGQAAESRAQTAARYEATAVLLADGPTAGTVGRGGVPGESGPTRAFWLTRTGQRHVGEVDAPAGTVVGNQVPVWLDAAGTPVDRPLTPIAAAVDAAVVAIGLWAGVVFLLVLAHVGVVAVLNRLRLARWQREWFARQPGPTRRDDQSPAGS
ncbi:Rv1733c family protein [Amycolatopsis sp. NPDC004747]